MAWVFMRILNIKILLKTGISNLTEANQFTFNQINIGGGGNLKKK